MTVSVSGDTITIQGVETDSSIISAISAVAGCVAMVESGTTRLVIPYKVNLLGQLANSAAVAYTFARPGSPANEFVIAAGASFKYEESRTVNGLTDWRRMPPIVFTQTANAGYNGQSSNLIYVNGGNLTLSGVEVRGNGGQYYNGGVVKFRKVILNGEGLPIINDNQITTQSGNPTIDIIDFEVRGMSVFFKGANVVNFDLFKPKFVSRGYGGGFGEQITLPNFDASGAVYDVAVYGGGQGGAIRLNNPAKGGAVNCGPWNSPSNNTANPNTIYSTADIILTSTNESGEPVLFKAFYADNNTGAPVGIGVSGTNYTLLKPTNQLSTTGGVNAINILLGVALNDNAMVRRSATQLNDLYVFKCFSYLSKPTSTEAIDLSGTGVKTAKFTQLKDTAISQLTKAIVDAYTSIDNPDRLYDRAKSYLFGVFAGEAVTLLTPRGTVLDAGSCNIVIDAAAAAPFAFNSVTNTITIKASVFAVGVNFKSLATTGTVTTANGASITAPFTDASNAGSISVTGLNATDRAEMRKASDASLIASRTGPGLFAVAPANIGLAVYFVRLQGASLVMSTVTAPVTLIAGVNANVPLFAGAEVQLAQALLLETVSAQISDMVKVQGLVVGTPVVIGPTSIVAGSVSQTVSAVGDVYTVARV